MGGRISESTLREIRDRADIVEVVSDSVRLARSGASYKGLCPFHREKTPSFFVHPSRQIFHCFGCGEGGSVFHFLMKTRNLSFAEAVEDLGERYGVPVRYEGGLAARRPEEDLYRIVSRAADVFRELLKASPGGKAGRDLLRRRGVGAEAEAEFSLGYGGEGRDLQAVFSREGIDPARAAAAGLLAAREGGGGWRERFRGRVVFPIADARGRVCGFGARAIGDAVPKYVNSPESAVYRKSSVLYGLYQALSAVREEKRVIVVEGYMDLIGLWQRGLRNVVATCGTSLTESHARTLKRLAEDVILLYDGDVAGKRSAVRAGGPLYGAGVSPLAVFPPSGLDPDDWARETEGAELRERIGRAAPLMEVIERSAARKCDLSQIAGKLAYLNLMGKYLPWVTDPAEKRLYVQRVARSAGLPEETVLERLGRERAQTRPPGGGGSAAPPADRGESSPEEDLLPGLFLCDPALVARAVRDGVPELVAGEDIREVIALLAAASPEGPAADPRDVIDSGLSDEARKRISGRLLRAEVPPGEAGRIYPEVVLGLRLRKARKELFRLRDEIKAAGGGEGGGALFARMVAVRNEIDRLEQERKNARAR